jgi:hypothetical protein
MKVDDGLAVDAALPSTLWGHRCWGWSSPSVGAPTGPQHLGDPQKLGMLSRNAVNATIMLRNEFFTYLL